MSLWDWVRQAWERPGFAKAWIALQDGHGQCAPLLLWAVWLAESGRSPDDDAIATAVLFSRAGMTTIQPLRDVRRAASPSAKGALLHRELEEERALLERMETIAVPKTVARVDLAEILSRVSARWGSPLDPAVIRDLLQERADV